MAGHRRRLQPAHPQLGLLPNGAAEERRALTQDERRRIEALFTTHEHGLYLATMYYTGMRPGEVRGLQWGDVDWDAAEWE